MIYRKRNRHYCPRCLILVPAPGLCPDCAAGEGWIVYCKGEGDERYWLRRHTRFVDPDQTEAQERAATYEREKRHKVGY